MSTHVGSQAAHGRRGGRTAALVGLLGAGLLVAGVATWTSASAAAPAGAGTSRFTVTLVARQCPSYADIMANRARNNIQESLQDLGPDKLYSAGQPVKPEVEDQQATSQRVCDPLENFRFQLGTGITARAVDNLSIVTNPYPATGPTQASVPLLDDQGQPVPGQQVKGAVTITLTDQQANLAAQSSRLWVHGGTTANPLLNGVIDPPIGFGALRCAIDNLNGDNVEWIGYPSGVTHVFCYYFAVVPPPQAATLVVRKDVTGGPVNRPFAFAGNVSYVPSGTPREPDDNPFTVPVSGTTGSTSFIRAAGVPWTFYEPPDPDFAQTSVVCSSTGGGSTWTVPPTVDAAHPVRVTMAAGETVTCGFTDAPNVAGLRLEKVTDEGVGTFDLTATSPAGTNAVTQTVTTVEPGRAVAGPSITGPSGTFGAEEDLPAGDDPNAWKISRVSCNGTDLTPTPVIGQQTTGPIPPGGNVLCTVYDAPQGEIHVTKVTHGGTGRFGFEIQPLGGYPLDGPDGGVGLSATTTAAGVPAAAQEIGLGTSTGLPFQRYSIVETLPDPTAHGSWRLTSFTCTGANDRPISVDGDPSGVVVPLTPADPVARCRAVDEFVPAATLDVVKSVVGDPTGRTAVHIAVQCNDAQNAQLTAPAGDPGPFRLPAPLRFYDFLDASGSPTLQCRVRETADGAAPGGSVDTSIEVVVDGAVTSTVNADNVLVAPEPGQEVVVRVTNRYAPRTVAPTPTPTPTPGPPAGGGSGSGGPGSLPGTGAGSWPAAGLLAIAMIGLGVALVLATRRTHKVAVRP